MDMEMKEEFVLLRQQVQGMDSTLKAIAKGMEDHAAMRFQQEQHTRDLMVLETAQTTHEKDITAAHRKVDEWLNRGRGALWAGIIFGGIIQGLVGAAIGYTFSHMRTAEDAVLLLTYRMNTVETRK